METNFVGLCKWRMVARKPGAAESRLEFDRKKVMEAVEDYLENCAPVKVDIEVLESMLKPAGLIFSVEALEKCALIAMQKKRELGGDWKVACPRSPMWEREGEVWSQDDSVSSSGSREGNVRKDALHVVGLHGPR